MRQLLPIVFFIALYSCQSGNAQKVDATLSEDREFEEFMKQVNDNQVAAARIQAAAAQSQTKLVEQTVSKIVTLKTEVSTLKTELNDVKQKLDSVTADTGSSYRVLPIDHLP